MGEQHDDDADERGTDGDEGHGVSRRTLLTSAGLAAGAALTPVAGWTQSSRSTVAEAFAARGDAPVVLSRDEYALVEALFARLIPSDEHGPGAREARAARYLDLALGGALTGERERYAAGLAAVDAHARAVFGAPCVELGEADQDAVLIALQDGEVQGFDGQGSAAFFSLLRTHALQGTFADPFYGGNEGFVGWDLIGYPGVRMGVGEELTRMGMRHTPNHLSAYDLGMFEDGEI